MVRTDIRTAFLQALSRLLLGLFVVCAMAQAPALAADGKVALIVGNSKYVNGGNLPNPSNDAQLVKQAAIKAGFDVVELEDLGLAQFRQALLDFRTKADSADVAMIYFAGHGIEVNGENWLIPTDVTLADPRDLRIQALPLSEVFDAVARAKVRMILLDACRNNPFRDKWTSTTRSFNTGLAPIDASDGTVVIFAANQGSTISDGQEGGNSYFAQAISKRLPEPGLSLQLMGGSISDDVKQMSGDRQRPLARVNLSGIPYILVPKQEATPGGPGPLDPDDFAFYQAQQANTPCAFLDYLKVFPTGRHSQVAQMLYSALSKNSPNSTCGTTPIATAPSQPPRVVNPNDPLVKVSNDQLQGPAQPTGAALAAGTNAPAKTSESQASTPPGTLASASVASTYAQPAIAATMASPPGPMAQAAPPATTSYQSSFYTAPATERRFGTGGFPIMPDAPAFSPGPYPTCKNNWQSILDPMARVNSTIACKNAYNEYKVNWLNRYRVALNDYGALITQIYQKEVAPPNFTGRDTEVQQFYTEMAQRMSDIKDGGRLMADYERTLLQFDNDFREVIDSYNRTSGCAGYPTPPGLAANPYC